MIYDMLKNASVYSLGPAFEKAVEFIRGISPDIPAGRYDLDGEKVYAKVMEYETKEGQPEKYEVHRQYADLQAVITGHETIFARMVDGLTIRTPYNPEKDCELLNPDGQAVDAELQLFPGYFTLLFPQDAHMGKGMTCLGKCKLKKVVVKIALDVLHP